VHDGGHAPRRKSRERHQGDGARDANIEPPTFDDRRASFLVAFPNHTMMNPDAIECLIQFAGHPINERQRLALVYLRQHGQITNPEYRRLNRVNPLVAGQELRGLLDSDLAVRSFESGSWQCRVRHMPPCVKKVGICRPKCEFCARFCK
jgi:predicted HTH transcriptional regulator